MTDLSDTANAGQGGRRVAQPSVPFVSANGQAASVGCGRFFRIRAPGRFEAHRATVRERLLRQGSSPMLSGAPG
jgi:hypothetical protein